jgi:Leucine-rich repeat (LRR) protein
MCLSSHAEGNQLTTIAPIAGLAFQQLITLELGFNRIAALEPLLSITIPQLQRLLLGRSLISRQQQHHAG